MKFWHAITLTGTAPVYLVAVALLSAFSVEKTEASFWLRSLIPSGVAWMIATLLKKITKKKRPDTDERDAMPSSHAAASVAWASTLVFLNHQWAYYVIFWSLLVCLSRFILKRHDAWDLFFGACLGISCSYLITFLH
jgi:membrane-associated phospholipid phosphatase